YRIEPTHSVTNRKQACRERLEALKMAPSACRETETNDVGCWPRILDCVIDCRGAKALHEVKEASPVAGRNIAMIAADRDHPLLLLDRNQKSHATACRCTRKKKNACP